MTADENAPFNPLDSPSIAETLVREVLSRTAHPITELAPFNGAGIYVLYYSGNNPTYASLARANTQQPCTRPIYVGKAVPEGSRRGLLTTPATTKALYKRLVEHRESLELAANLDVDDFQVRYLVVEPLFISLGEALLIQRFLPVWNRKLDGFGNHPPGSGRGNQKRSGWDTLHPGRTWAAPLPDRAQAAEHLQQDVEEYLRQRLPQDDR